MDWFESGGSLVEGMPFLQHQAAKIARAALAKFLTLERHGVEAPALGTVHAKLFETAEDANAGWIAQTANSQLVKQ